MKKTMKKGLAVLLVFAMLFTLMPVSAFAADNTACITDIGIAYGAKSSTAENLLTEKGYTIVPLQIYFKGSLVKVEIGLAKGKKLYDKRQDIIKKDQRREAERDFKVKNLY